MSMKNSIDTIGKRNRDLSACSAVPQPTAKPHAPKYVYNHYQQRLRNGYILPQNLGEQPILS
jgi:hypothetical protein